MSGLNKETSGNFSKETSGSLSKGLGKVQVSLMWDPSPLGEPDHDLDIIAGTYSAENPHGKAAYLVHFDRRLSPDGTINLNRDSRTGAGFGADEVMTLELDRLSSSYARVVVGVAIQQNGGRKTFGDVPNTGVRVVEGYTELVVDDFAAVAGATAATVVEFVRDSRGVWECRRAVRGFDADPQEFAAAMGGA
ncbi:TerD family protein [Streptomyces roseoverticillatus]|uniref:TerD family protein n=1 Tax=Streptomyces roseoverticillatus TaxID=66429 RepID=A0ABV3IZL5_9ACTN